MTQKTLIKIAQGLIILKAIIWLVFAALYVGRHIGDTFFILVMIPVLMVVNAAIFAWLAWGIGRRSKWVWLAAVAYLALNIILTVTDEFGFFDMLVLVLDVTALLVLFVTRRAFLQGQIPST